MLVDYCFYCRWFDIEHLRLSPSRSAMNGHWDKVLHGVVFELETFSSWTTP